MGSLPEELLDDMRRGEVAVLVGSGISRMSNLPGWNDIVGELAQKLGIDPDVGGKEFSLKLLLSVPQFYANTNGLLNLQEFLVKKINQPAVPSKAHKLIAQLPVNLYYTTNWDKLLEKALEAEQGGLDVLADEPNARAFSKTEDNALLVKLHGTIDRAESLVATTRDYGRFRMEHALIAERFRHDLSEYTFLFLGYSLSDPDFNALYDQVFYALCPWHRCHYVAIDCTTISEYEKADLHERGLQVIDLNEFGRTPEGRADMVGFLTELRKNTSDAIHIQGFFRGLKRKQKVPIVISRVVAEDDPHLYYPACDIYLERQLANALSAIGCIPTHVDDVDCLRKEKEYFDSDIVLVCAPYGNQLTELFFKKAAKKPGVKESFTKRGEDRILKSRKREFVTHDPMKKVGDASREGYGLIARYPNPWSPGHHVFVFAGSCAASTRAIGQFLSDQKAFEYLSSEDEERADAAFVLRVEYRDESFKEDKLDINALIDMRADPDGKDIPLR